MTWPIKTQWSPASIVSLRVQTAYAAASSSRIGPPTLLSGRRHLRASNLSGILEAMRRASCSRPAARMLAVNPPVCWTAGNVFEVLSMQARANGGSSETAQKALTVSPRGKPSGANAVSTTTPLGKLAMISRNRSGSINPSAE